MEKYRFPRFDRAEAESATVEIKPIKSLEFILNLACNRLTPELRDFYSNLLQRDVTYPEISAQGVKSTKFDLKTMSARYKKQKEKDNYIYQLLKGISTKNRQSADQKRQVSPDKPRQVSPERTADLDNKSTLTRPVTVNETMVSGDQDLRTSESDTELDIFHSGTEGEFQ